MKAFPRRVNSNVSGDNAKIVSEAIAVCAVICGADDFVARQFDALVGLREFGDLFGF